MSDRRRARRLLTEQRRERHAVHVPLVVVSGVFMSPCASTQIGRAAMPDVGEPSRRLRRPIPPPGCDRRRAPPAAPLRRATSSDVVVERLAHARDLVDVLLVLVGRVGSRNRRRHDRPVDHVRPSAGDLIAESGDAERRRPHVDAAPAAAEVEGHADDVDGFQLPTPKSPTPKMGCCREWDLTSPMRRSGRASREWRGRRLMQSGSRSPGSRSR